MYINVNFQLCDHWVIYDPNVIKFTYLPLNFNHLACKFHLLNITSIFSYFCIYKSAINTYKRKFSPV